MTTEEIHVMCFDCGLSFTVKAESPEVIKIFAEAGCLSPDCRAVHALLLSEDES